MISNRKDKNNHSGKRYINNGYKCLCINPDDFPKYESLGFIWGRLTDSEGHKNMRDSHKFASVKLKCLELDLIFANPREVNEYFGSYGHIYDIINGKRSRTLGYTWEVINGEG